MNDDSLSHTLVHISFYVIYAFSVLSNAILLYLVVFETPRNLRTYSITLFSLAVLDLITSIATPLVVPSFKVVGPVLVYVYHGICTVSGAALCSVLFASSIASITTSFPALAISFAYRYRRLTSRKMNRLHVIIATLFVHVGSILMQISFVVDRWDEDTLRIHLDSFIDEANEEEHISGLKPFPSPGIIYILMWSCLGTSLSFIFILYFRYRIHKVMRNSRQYMSTQTVNMHSMLTKAISIQACLPAVNMLILLIDVLDVIFDLQIPHKEELQFSMMGFLPALTPCISLYFIVPYRRRLCSLFMKCQRGGPTISRSAMISIAVTPGRTIHSSEQL